MKAARVDGDEILEGVALSADAAFAVDVDGARRFGQSMLYWTGYSTTASLV